MENSAELNIAGYCRISVDMEVDRDNTSIENQKAITFDTYVGRDAATRASVINVDALKTSGYGVFGYYWNKCVVYRSGCGLYVNAALKHNR